MDVLGKLLLQLGWPGFISFLLLAVAATAAIQWLKQWKFKKDAEKNGIQVGNESDLRYHMLFATAQYRLAIELPNLEIFPDKPVRRQLMVDLLRIYIKTIHDGCKEIATTNMKGWSADQWTIEMSTRMSQMISAANSTARLEGLPDAVITKFTRWAGPSFDMMFTYVENIGASTAYASNVVRTNTLFLIMNLLMSTMLGDAERSIKELNGDITGQVYKGQIIEAVEH